MRARRLGRHRGAAMVEAVILLPVLLLLLIGARVVERRRDAQVAALEQARLCAVRFAQGGCTEVPRGCEVSASSRSRAAISPVVSPLSRAIAEAEGVVRILSSVPVLGGAVDVVLGQRAQAVGRATVDHTTTSEEGRVLFPCNEAPGPDDVAKQIFSAVTKPFF